MRTIKFRQPIYDNGKFSEWMYWGFLDGEGGGFTSPAIPTHSKNEGRYQSQQFIGLFDGSQEIYEGDVVVNRNFVLVVEYRAPSFVLILQSGSGPEFKGSSWPMNHFDKDGGISVIGNIVETHPEFAATCYPKRRRTCNGD